MVRRNGVPPISARHLQEAIISSTILYGSEVTYRGQATLEKSVQKSINRTARSTLGVMQSTPVCLLMENAGSMPAAPRLRARQKAFAVRMASSDSAEIRKVAEQRGPVSERIRDLAREQGIGVARGQAGRVERTGAPGGLFFPGEITVPSSTPTDTEKEKRNHEALEQAERYREDPHMLWTDRLAFPSRVAAAAVVGFMEPGAAGSGPSVSR